MKEKASLYNLSSYKYSDSFSDLHSEASYKSLAFIDFLEDGESLVKAKQSKLDALLKALYEKDEEEGQIFEQQDHFLESTINKTLEESFLLAASSYLFSQFEYLMFAIAKKTGELFNSPVEVDKYAHRCKKNKQGISQALAYIQEYSKISFNDLNGYWSDIKQFQKIRNCIVHANGIVKSNYKGLDAYAETKKNGLLYKADSNQIIIKKEYLLELRKKCFDFLEKIMEKVWENRPKKDLE